MSSRHKRSSILKKRPSVDPGSQEASPSEATITTKSTKRIGFRPKKSVKEFFASDETATIWCNSYELSTDKTPPCLAVNGDTTLKNSSGTRQVNKENITSTEDRRSSFNESSIWDLSISAHEDEKRRVKSEASMNSSVLNMTEKLIQEPVLETRKVLRQKQNSIAQQDSSAMDISPIKLDGKLKSPKKLLFHHPKQNMFVSIDVQNEKPITHNLNESDINFYGPKENQNSSNITKASKILFQASNPTSYLRNKSIQTEPRMSTIDLCSTAGNVDASTEWNSHAALPESFGRQLTFGNSQFDFSEAWNSHPAAALKLKMGQQRLKSVEFDPRLSDGGGGENSEDVDTTLAIAQTVAKMLGRGSRPVSLDNTQYPESEPMDVTRQREIHKGRMKTDISTNMDVVEDATISDVLIPINALSRARPSFIPTVAPTNHSDSISPQKVESVSRHRLAANQRATILDSIPIECLDHEASPALSPLRRQTIVQDDKIIEDNSYLTVPQVDAKTPPNKIMRHTVYESKMDQSSVATEAKATQVIMEPVKIDFSDLVFGDNSFGLELARKSEAMQLETNRPKIHRIPSKNFKLGLYNVTSTQSETQKNLKANESESSIVDSTDPKIPAESVRRTINNVDDISMDAKSLNDLKIYESHVRRTDVLSQDVSMQSPVNDKLQCKRPTVYVNDNLNESEKVPIVNSDFQNNRATILFNEKLSESNMEPRGESLEDLTKNDKTRCTLQRMEAMDYVSLDSSNIVKSSNTRRTKIMEDDLDQSIICVENVQFKPRFSNAVVDIMDVSERHSSHDLEHHDKSNTQFQHITGMDQSSCQKETHLLDPLLNKQNSRQTVIRRESMNQTIVEDRSKTVQEIERPTQRKSTFSEEHMDETCFPEILQDPSAIPKSRHSSYEAIMEETCKSATVLLEQSEQQSSRLSCSLPINMNKEKSINEHQVGRSVLKAIDMDETVNSNEGSTEKSLPRSEKCNGAIAQSRQTNCAVLNIDETLSPDRKLEATLLKRSKAAECQTVQVTRNTIHQETNMDESCYVISSPDGNNIVDLTSSPQDDFHFKSPLNMAIIEISNAVTQESKPSDEVIYLDEPTYPAHSHSPVRYTTYNQHLMEESALATDLIVPSNNAQRQPRVRKTVSCELDMEQTVRAVKRVSIVEIDDSVIIDDDADFQDAVASLDDRIDELQINNSAIQLCDEMDVSVIRSSSAPVETIQNTRRTCDRAVSITEDQVKSEVENQQSPLSIEDIEVQTNIVKQEQNIKSDFSFIVPALPDDFVLRCSNQVSFFKSDQRHYSYQLAQPEYVNVSLTDPSFRQVNTLFDLSEITPKEELSYGFGRRPPILPDNMSIDLKDVSERLIASPSIPFSVIQETPKKPCMLPVRQSRSSFMDRLSIGLDESGVGPIVPPEHVHQPSGSLQNIDDGKVHPSSVQPIEVNVIVKNEPDSESSDEEFFDAVRAIDEPVVEQVYINREAKSRAARRSELKFAEVKDQTNIEQSLYNETAIDCKSLKFVDVNNLEQTAVLSQKRHLSEISKSTLLEENPLNASLTNDYPKKKRKTRASTCSSRSKTSQTDQTARHVTFRQDVENHNEVEISTCPKVEMVNVKEELQSRIDESTDNHSKLGQTIKTDASLYLTEENDELANESNITLVNSPSCEMFHPVKIDNTFYKDYVNLTLHTDQHENMSYLVVSDDSVLNKTENLDFERRLTLDDLSNRISTTRRSLVLNSTVASDIMCELRQQVLQVSRTCCSFKGNCNCRTKRTLAAVRSEIIATIRGMWNQAFEKIVESVSDIPRHDIPVDVRICEVFSRHISSLPLPCRIKQKSHQPETASIWKLYKNYKRSPQISDTPQYVYNHCDLPEIPSILALIKNKLETEGFRWFLDVSNESNSNLYLRHRVLRSVRFKLHLKKAKRWYSKEEDVRIVKMECLENRNDLVPSPRLFVAHHEFVRSINEITVDYICSRNPTTAHLIQMVEQLDSVIETVFKKVDQLNQIVRNNGAILEQLNDDQLLIEKFFEYHHEGVLHWNRVYIKFSEMDQIDDQNVFFHQNMVNSESLYPTEHQCGRIDIRGLIFLECFLWNIERMSTS